MNNTLDALNLNNSLITSLSKDLRTSLQPFTPYREPVAGGGDLTKEDDTLKNRWCLGDYSNFRLGIPICDSEDFMGGISTTGSVQIELSGNRKKPDDTLDLIPYRATAICFEDALLKIRAVKPDGRSQIEITNASTLHNLFRAFSPKRIFNPFPLM